MTQTLIEKLEALPRYEYRHHENNRYWDEPCVRLSDLRAIIEQAPVRFERLHPSQGWIIVDEQDIPHYLSQCQTVRPLFAAPQPDIVAELVKALEPIGQRFVSGNDVPVSRASVTAEEWQAVQELVAKAKEMMG